MSKRKQHHREFNEKVALEARKGEETVSEPRAVPRAELERYCEIIAALKIRKSKRKGADYRQPAPSTCWRIMVLKRPKV